MWSYILLVIAALVTISLLLARADRKLESKTLFLTFAVFFAGLGTALPFWIEPYQQIITEYSQITSISLVLTALAILIRQLKPVYARYPAVFSFVPLLLIPIYPLIRDASVLKDLLNMILQGGALFVAILMLFVLKKERAYILTYIAAWVFLTVAYFIYWLLPEMSLNNPWTWQVTLSFGMILMGVKLTDLINESKS